LWNIDLFSTDTHYPRKEKIMHKYVIEREIPGAGKLTAAELQGISAKSCGVLRKLGPAISSA